MYKMLKVSYLYFLLIFYFIYPISSEEIQDKNTVSVGSFQSLEGQSSLSLESKLKQTLLQKFQNENIPTKQVKGNSVKSMLNEAKRQGSSLLVTGFYSKKSPESNADLYVQIYDVNKRQIIDAFSVTDELYKKMEIQLDPNEMKESDDKRVSKLVEKTDILIRSNPSKKEKRYNIEEHILPHEIKDRVRPYLSSGEEASEKDIEQVFNLLQSQITTASTKTAKRTNEAPNIVSVFQQEEIQDYGRFSINDVLYSMPGFSPSQVNERRTVAARGMFEGWNNNHLLLLVDGIQFNESFYGTALTPEMTPLSMVKSMEVIRGPGSALYGSNATNGVVSLNTLSGSDMNGQIYTRARIGEQGTKNYNIMTGNTGELFSHFVSYSSFRTNGNEYETYDDSGRTDVFGFLQKFPTKDNRDSYYIFTKLEGEGVLKGLSFQYHRQVWNYQTFNGWLFLTADFDEKQTEFRDTYVAKYSNKITDKLWHEYVISYNSSGWDYNNRSQPKMPDYPAGIWENLKTDLYKLFARIQFTYFFDNGGSLVGGVEGTKLTYKGDREHNSNYDMNLLGSDDYFPNGYFFPLEPYMDWVTNKPIYKVAPFIQATSGRLINKKVEFTLGVRYDESINHFRGIDIPYKDVLGVPTFDYYDPYSDETYSFLVPTKLLGPPYVTNEKKVYRKTSPRVGVVLFATKSLTLKAMTGLAFREPSIGELYGINTFVGGSNNPRRLGAEVIRTSEFGIDYFLNRYVNFRINAFNTKFDNVIDYSNTDNTISNVYTLGTRGVESEILVTYNKLSGYINFSRFYRFHEYSIDPTVSKHPKEVTSTPATTANFGIRFLFYKILLSLSTNYRGPSHRKNSSMGTIEPITGYLLDNTYSDPYTYPMYRPKVVPSWVNIDFRMMYKISEKFQMGGYITNLTNSSQFLLEVYNIPSDYIRERRRIFLEFIGEF